MLHASQSVHKLPHRLALCYSQTYSANASLCPPRSHQRQSASSTQRSVCASKVRTSTKTRLSRCSVLTFPPAMWRGRYMSSIYSLISSFLTNTIRRRERSSSQPRMIYMLIFAHALQSVDNAPSRRRLAPRAGRKRVTVVRGPGSDI